MQGLSWQPALDGLLELLAEEWLALSEPVEYEQKKKR